MNNRPSPFFAYGKWWAWLILSGCLGLAAWVQDDVTHPPLLISMSVALIGLLPFAVIGMTTAARPDPAGLEKLLAEQARLIAIIEATPDYVGISDTSGHNLYTNRAGRRMTGIGASEDISGKIIAEFHPPWALLAIEKTGIPI